MALFDKLFQSLSLRPSSDPKPGGRQILNQELIIRSAQFQQVYQEWTKSSQCTEMLQFFFRQYELSKYTPNRESLVSLYETPKASGAQFGYHNLCDPMDFEFLFDFMKERTIQLKYKSYVSDRIIYESAKYIETVQKHYLKPDYTLNTGTKAHQLYGNILIEHVLVDEQPNCIKILATRYSDSKYHDPLPFEQFLERIFQVGL